MCYWVTTRSVLVSFPRCRSLALLLRHPLHNSSPHLLSPSPLLVQCVKERRMFRTTARATKKVKEAKNVVIDGSDLSHILWWQEKLHVCKKPSTVQLIKRLVFTNLLGVDDNLRNGSLKEGTLNWEMLHFKSRFPHEVLLCRVGDFYEAIGIDACILVEYAGLNPFGGLRTDSIPRAGCPVVNLRQTLDDLTRNGHSVCIVEEVQGPVQARSRKGRFISGHAHPGSPYVYGLIAADHDLEFPEPMPVVGISHSAKGYSIVRVFETMKTYSAEDGLTEEALLTKLRTCRYHHLYLHTSLKHNSSGTTRWGEFGDGGLLWGECNARQFEWFEGNPLTVLFSKVKDLYGLEDEIMFRNVTVISESRPRPLHLSTATQIGVIPTEGIPCIMKVLLPSNCTGLPTLYVRDLLLNPPSYEIASKIQGAVLIAQYDDCLIPWTLSAICRLMSDVTCSIPEFTCVSSAKLVKLIELREANHVEFCRIKNVVDEILSMHRNPELNEIVQLLMDPTWVATGLKICFDTVVSECGWVSRTISEMISLEGETDQKISSYPRVPSEFFQNLESSWKGRIKNTHIKEILEEVERAAESLSLAISEDFLPIISRIRATNAPLGGPRGEILYAREHDAVWFKGKRFSPAIWAGTPGEEQIKQLKPALDSKGRKVGEEWFTTARVENALTGYHEASAKAKTRVIELLRVLSGQLQTKINILVFASMLLVIAKALFAHVSEGRRRKWVFPSLTEFSLSKGRERTGGSTDGLILNGLSPYWFDAAQGSAVRNTVDMKSLFLLTGPNGGGKSSLLRSICAASLLGICGFMVPAEHASIPNFDSIMLHMKSYDSPADCKSSFQIEMSEMRSLITEATAKSLVLVDEICRGTETAKGTCIAGSIIETLDSIGCLGIVSTHLHGIFSLPLITKNTVYKAMGTTDTGGQTKPTWKLRDGLCLDSLAFETAQREGVPEAVILRAEELYLSSFAENTSTEKCFNAEYLSPRSETPKTAQSVGLLRSELSIKPDMLQKDVRNAITIICQKKLIEINKKKTASEFAEVNCVRIDAREQPPPSIIGASSVYVMIRPDKKLYVGETDDLEGRIRAHRLKEGMQNAAFLYFTVAGKSIACQLETLLINQLPDRGFQLTNIADGKHRNFGTSTFSVETAIPVR
ncbi:unnamed protein product [Rhodiola kirilowii]